MDRDFRSPRYVFTDISRSTHVPQIAVAHVASADRWVIVHHFVNAAAGLSWVRAYFHDDGNGTANSGRTVSNVPPFGTRFAAPDVGGTFALASATNAVAVFEVHAGAALPKVMARRLDASARAFVGSNFARGEALASQVRGQQQEAGEDRGTQAHGSRSVERR